MINRVEKANIDKVITESMEEVAPLITDRQRDQWIQGLNSKGQKIRRYRSASYAKLKHAMNPVAGLGFWDLDLTGQFKKETFTEIRGDKVIIDSTNEKTQSLVDRAGEEIFGLNKPTKKELINDDLQPVFMKNIRKELKL
jgi:hypothetical protein